LTRGARGQTLAPSEGVEDIMTGKLALLAAMTLILAGCGII